MIQTPKEAKLLHILTTAITSACGTPEDSVIYAMHDTPLVVRMLPVKDSFKITDEHHSVTCEFSKGALFWFLMDNTNMSIKDLKDKHLVLNEYAPGSLLTEDKEVKVCIKIYSFTLLPEDEVTGMKSPSKTIKEVTTDKEMEPFLEILRTAHLRRALFKKKDISELPNLEDILVGGKTSGKKGGITSKPEVKLGKEKAKDMKEDDAIIEFEEIEGVEKSLREDVERLSIVAEEKKEGLSAGSEGNVRRKELFEACLKKIKDKQLADFLKDRGVLDRLRSVSKASPVKKGEMPEDLKEAVDKELEVLAEKRKKTEGKKAKGKKAEKKAAVEEEGKKSSASKSKKEGYTLRSKEGKKKGGK